MRNKKLIPFKVIQKAVAGEPEAVDIVLRYYTAHIKYLSMYKGHINDDTQERLKAKSADCFRPQSSMECLLHDGGRFSLDLSALQRR
jgi:hypothetical protein